MLTDSHSNKDYKYIFIIFDSSAMQKKINDNKLYYLPSLHTRVT